MAEALVWGDDKVTLDCLCYGVHIVANYMLCRAEQSCEDGIQVSIRACVSQWVMLKVLCCAQVHIYQCRWRSSVQERDRLDRVLQDTSWSTLTCGKLYNASSLLHYPGYSQAQNAKDSLSKISTNNITVTKKTCRTQLLLLWCLSLWVSELCPRCRCLLLRIKGPILGSSLCPRGSSNIWRCRNEWQTVMPYKSPLHSDKELFLCHLLAVSNLQPHEL